jgi:hypothetical protein
MYELSEADRIWNRACMGEVSHQFAGDRALAALLRLHGLAMNGGVLHAVECLNAQELEEGKSGYRYFGYDDVVDLLAEASSALETSDDLGSIESKLDRRYAALISDDSALNARFEAHLQQKQNEFAPA